MTAVEKAYWNGVKLAQEDVGRSTSVIADALKPVGELNNGPGLYRSGVLGYGGKSIMRSIGNDTVRPLGRHVGRFGRVAARLGAWPLFLADGAASAAGSLAGGGSVDDAVREGFAGIDRTAFGMPSAMARVLGSRFGGETWRNSLRKFKK